MKTQICFIITGLFSIAIANTPKSKIIINGVNAIVWASSELKDKELNKYSPSQAFDGSANTAWAEGNNSDGSGESICVEFEVPVLVNHIEIINGYQKNSIVYKQNNRIDNLQLTFDSIHSPLFSNIIVDSISTIQINKVIKTIYFTTKSIRRGNKYNDLCISEIKFRLKKIDNLNIKDNIYIRDGLDWIYTISQNKVQIKKIGNSKKLLVDTIIANFIPNDVKIDSLQDLQYGKAIVLRITLQSEYDRDSYLHFIGNDGKSYLFFHESSISNDGSLQYKMECKDFNKDGYIDVEFTGTCSYPDCNNIKKKIKFLSENELFLKRMVVE